MDSSEEDQRQPHQLEPNEDVPVADLDKYGVLSWSGITGEGENSFLKMILAYLFSTYIYQDDEKLAEIKMERGYTYTDIITISPEKLPEYDKKIKSFYREHIHYDEEIRLLLEGTGYFDIRDENDRWIRIALEAGDMIILPEGIYHRFTIDAKNYTKAMVSLL